MNRVGAPAFMKKQKRLGRGLDALLESRQHLVDASAQQSNEASAGREVTVEELMPGRFQPRRQLGEPGLAELADSIREQGVLQPLVVRPRAAGNGPARYEIVAGERRWRAAKLAGLTTVPVVVRELDDQSALAVALIENLQREDLNPLDQAESLARLAREFGLTHDQAAKAVGRSRASVSNLLRLLDLHDDVKAMLAGGEIDMGHGRALLALDPDRQVAMARQVRAKGWSVRQVEEAVRRLLGGDTAERPEKLQLDLQTRWLQQQIAKESGQKISIRPAKGGTYRLNIGFGELEQLQQALRRIQELVGQVRETAGPRARNSR
jgi:ParB family transcriptional regulator, chromosome partitioning protein